MRVLFLTQYFPPETGAAPARARAFARALKDAGCDVEVVTGMPNHPSGVISAGYRGKFHVAERVDGLSVTRMWLFASARKRLSARLLNQLTFAATALWIAPRRARQANVVVVTVPPTFLGLSAVALLKAFGRPLVVDVRDDWPRAAISLGQLKVGFATRALQRISDIIYSRADRLVVVTPGMRRQFLDRGVPESSMSLITNGVRADLYPEPRDSSSRVGGLRVIYTGTHGLVHCMDGIIEAAGVLRDENIHFLFVGDGVAKPGLVHRAKELALDNVEFRDSVAAEDLPPLLWESDVCLATTCGCQFCGETIPVKLFDYLASGRPTVGALVGDAAEVLRKSGGGVVVEPENADALAAALLALRDDPEARKEMGDKGRRFVLEQYTREVLGQRFADTVAAAAERGKSARLPSPSMPYGLGKRLGDIVLSAAGLIIASPVLLVVALAVGFSSAGPVFFRQRRIGRYSREFTMLKFRTMHVGAPDVATHLLGDPERHLTAVGKFLRRTSLDELPQLVHVLLGQMSLVGPRPALYNQFDLIALRRERGIDTLRPGLTGWAQVSGRDDLGIPEKVLRDEEYFDRVSPAFDLKCLLLTVGAVFNQRGAV